MLGYNFGSCLVLACLLVSLRVLLCLVFCVCPLLCFEYCISSVPEVRIFFALSSATSWTYTFHLRFSSQVQYGGDGGRQYYPTVDPALLEPEARYRRVVNTIGTSQADVVCLQGEFPRSERCAGGGGGHVRHRESVLENITYRPPTEG